MADEDHDFVLLGENDVQDFNSEGILPLSNDEILKVQKWLAPTDYAATSSEWGKHHNSHLAGTGTWILNTDQYQQWHGLDQGGLWIKAVAGAGKSVIAASIVSRLVTEEKAPVLYFFFRHIISANQKPKSLACDFLSQVLQYSPTLQSDLFKIIDGDGKSLDNVSLDELWSLLVLTLTQMPRVYCVIDALDEMDTENEQFLTEFVALAQKSPKSIKVLMTSRPIPRIEQYLRSTDVVPLVLQPQLINPDISAYVEHRLKHHPMNQRMRLRIHDSMCEKADGHFLYARLMIDDLLDPVKTLLSDESRLFTALNELPAPMADMYTQMLFEHSQRSHTPQGLQVAVLQWVTRAERPLRLLELSSLINTKNFMPQTNKDAKSIIRDACGPLLEVFEDETVHPIHHSFTEYLYDKSRADLAHETLKFPILEYGEAQRVLAVTCLERLASGWHTQSPALFRTSSGRTRGREGLSDRHALKLKYPYLRYAAENWHHHLRKFDALDETVVMAIETTFLENTKHFHAWLSWENSEASRADYGEDGNVTNWSLLHTAADKGVPNFVNLLLLKGYEVDQPTKSKLTPLALAARSGHHQVVQVLLNHGACSDMPDVKGLKPLHHATESNHWRVAQLLVEAGVSPYTPKTKEDPGRLCGNARSTKGDTPVQYACSSGHLETVKVFIPFMNAENLQEALHFALVCGQTETAIELLQRPSIDVNCYVRNHTPLYLASRVRDLKVMRLLLEKGAEAKLLSSEHVGYSMRRLNSLEKRCSSPLHAFGGGDDFRYRSRKAQVTDTETILQGLTMLLDAGIDPNSTNANGYTILHILVNQRNASRPIESKDSDYVKLALDLLIKRGLRLDLMTNEGSNALHLASRVAPCVVDLLLDHGVGVNVARKLDGKTPLMIAIEQNEIPIAQLLIQKGANVNATDSTGKTPLHRIKDFSKSKEKVDLAKNLIDQGADIHSRNNNGDTALHVGQFHSELTKVFVRYGFNLETKNKQGRTLLSLAVSGLVPLDGYKQLVELGADPLTRDKQGRTILHHVVRAMYSRSINIIQTIRYFVAQGVDPRCTDMQGNNLWHTMAGLGAMHNQAEQFAVMDLLMEYGVPAEATNLDGQVPLHIAFSVDQGTQSPGPLQFLFERTKPDVNISDYNNIRPLHLTASFSDKLTCFLLEHGADVAVSTTDGQTPLMVACRTRQCNIVCILLDHFHQHNMLHLIDQEDMKGRTALHHACRSGRPESVALLLEAGASVHQKDNQQATPLHACAEYLEEDLTWHKLAQSDLDYVDRRRLAFYILSCDTSRPERGYCRYDPVRVRETIRLLIQHGADTSFLTRRDNLNLCSRPCVIPDDEHEHDNPLAVAISKKCGPMVSELRLIQESLLRAKSAGDRLTNVSAQDRNTTPTPNSSKQLAWINEVGDIGSRLELLKVQHMPEVIANEVKVGENNFHLVQNLLRMDEEPAVRQIAELGACFHVLETWGDSVPEKLVGWGFADLLRESDVNISHMTAAWSREIRSKKTHPCPERISSILLTALHRYLPNMAVVKVIVSVFQHDVNEMFRGGSRDEDLTTYLHLLARPSCWWQTRALSYLLDNGADVDRKDSNCETPLVVALRESDSNIHHPERVRAVEILLGYGANPNAVDKNGLSCLNIAARQPRCVLLLLRHGANPLGGIRPFLLDAVEMQDVEIVKHVIASGADVNRLSQDVSENTSESERLSGRFVRYARTDVQGWSTCSSLASLSAHAYPIHVAASHLFNVPEKLSQARNIIDLLLNNGADPFLTYEDGSSILHCLARSDGIMEPFFSHPSFDTELRDSKGRTLLLAACDRGWIQRIHNEWTVSIGEVAKALIDRGASITAVDNEGRNALHYLLSNFPTQDSYWEASQLILLPFIPPLLLQTDFKGRSPYHYAVTTRYADLIQLLLVHGSDPRTPDPADGTTTLHHLAATFVSEDPLNPEIERYMLTRNVTTKDSQESLYVSGPGRIATFARNLSPPKLEQAIRRSPRRLFASLISRGLSVNHQDVRGETPLFKLADTGATTAAWIDDDEAQVSVGLLHSMFQFMAEHGANLQLRNHARESVLHKLAQHPADLRHKIVRGESREKDLRESFKWLVSQGVDVTWEDNEQRTCLDVAAVSGATWLTQLYERE